LKTRRKVEDRGGVEDRGEVVDRERLRTERKFEDIRVPGRKVEHKE
jgi:hypothetical protein